MADRDGNVRNAALARLAQSRAEIRLLLEPRKETGDDLSAGIPDETANFGTFPRSRTMRMLLTGRGLGTAGAVVGGLLLARPTFALRLLRMLPASAVAKMLLVKAFSSLRSSPKNPR